MRVQFILWDEECNDHRLPVREMAAVPQVGDLIDVGNKDDRDDPRLDPLEGRVEERIYRLDDDLWMISLRLEEGNRFGRPERAAWRRAGFVLGR